MEKTRKLKSVAQFNAERGQPVLHPLVSVLDQAQSSPVQAGRWLSELYLVFLKQAKCSPLTYGRRHYDYDEGTMLFVAPGQVFGLEEGEVERVQPTGWALAFHPDLIRGTALGQQMKEYSFFGYEANEALHLSERERALVMEGLRKIGEELTHPIDKHSKQVIASHIQLLLNYCVRFYDRQFITRDHVHKDVLVRFEALLADYFESDKPQNLGLPTVGYCAEQLHLSANYFGDLVKKETGQSPHDRIQAKVIELAKERVFDLSKSVSEIAYELGFKYPQHFTRLFKQRVGQSPNEYRRTADAVVELAAQPLRRLNQAYAMKCLLLPLAVAFLLSGPVWGQVPNQPSPTNANRVTPDRVERAQAKYEQLFGQPITPSKTDPELMTILQRFIFGEVFYVGNLDDKTRELITITALTTNQTLPQLTPHTNAALNVGVTPIQIREVLYQCAPFIGFPKVLNALEVVNKVFESRGIKLPLESKGTVSEEQRFERGRERQAPLYGEAMKQNMKALPGEFAEAIPRMLTESGFGDFYTREGLDLKTRELMIFCALATLGGTERQMASHAVGNLKAGNSKETLLAAMVQLYPYIGFPRVSNAINVLKDAKID